MLFSARVSGSSPGRAAFSAFKTLALGLRPQTSAAFKAAKHHVFLRSRPGFCYETCSNRLRLRSAKPDTRVQPETSVQAARPSAAHAEPLVRRLRHVILQRVACARSTSMPIRTKHANTACHELHWSRPAQSITNAPLSRASAHRHALRLAARGIQHSRPPNSR